MVLAAITLGQAAELSRTSIDMIEYYQRIGLIDNRAAGDVRPSAFDETVVDRLRFIRRAKDLGFGLPEIRELLQLDQSNCADAKRIAENKLAMIRQKIAGLQAIEEVLTGVVNCCVRSTNAEHSCGLLQLLGSDQI